MTVQEPEQGGELAGLSDQLDAYKIDPLEEPPKAGGLAPAGKIIGAAISSVPIPVVGNVAGAVFDLFVERGQNKKRDAFESNLVMTVNRLIEHNNALFDNDALFTATVKAYRIALATHQQEKLDALRNAVVNSVALDSPSDDEQARFFRMIDELEPSHLVVLSFLEDPVRALQQLREEDRPAPQKGTTDHFNMGELLAVVAPNVSGNREWRDLLIDDLATNRLCLTFSTIDDMYALPSVPQSFATPLGRRFLRFISEPSSRV